MRFRFIVTTCFCTLCVLIGFGQNLPLKGRVPYPCLFNAKASRAETNGAVWVPNTFQTAGLYEFAHKQYDYLFLTHNFGQLLGRPKIPYSQPEILVVQNVGYGTLDRPEMHQDVTLKSMEKGFYESGVLVRNLVRIPYFGLIYIGLGGGVFCRYGAYALPTFKDNLVYKLTVTMSF